MIRSIKPMFLGIVFILAISLTLPGCYTQLSRPRVDVEDEYEYSEESTEYYQDEGAQPAEDTEDVSIYNYNYYNYRPYSWIDYFDFYDYGYYSPYRWSYLGPNPYYWWDPYGHWWMPGWYAGYYYYDSWWGHSGYYGSYYGGGYYVGSQKTYGKRAFSRRSILPPAREKRIDSQDALSRPLAPTRVDRSSPTYSTPAVKNQAVTTKRSVREMVKTRLKAARSKPKLLNTGRTQKVLKKRPIVRTKPTVRQPQRTGKSSARPSRIIERPKPRYKPSGKSRRSSPPSRSIRKSGSSSRSSSHISRPSAPSYTPRSSGVSSSSSSRSSGSRSSGSRSSGASRTKRK